MHHKVEVATQKTNNLTSADLSLINSSNGPQKCTIYPENISYKLESVLGDPLSCHMNHAQYIYAYNFQLTGKTMETMKL